MERFFFFFVITANRNSLALGELTNMSTVMPHQLTELEVAMLMHMKFIIGNEHRPFSYLDFLYFQAEGKEFTMTHGTFRNKIWKLRREGIVELVYNSGIAFYTLKGVKVGKQTAATSMTPNHIGVLLQYLHRIPNIKKHLLYKCIKHHRFGKAAVHDIHLKFTVAGLWSKLSSYSTNNSTSAVQLEPYNKALLFQKRIINELEIQIAIHRTDTVTVVIGCSSAPIVVDVYGVIRLSEALAEIEDELNRMIEQQQHASDTASTIDIPNHMSWIVTRWDFGIDGLVTYTGKEFFFSWQTSQNVLIVFYTKKWDENIRRLRVECPEFPNKALGKALKERLSPKKGS
jgi:hypothetical protein